jgi:hypothetical protein
MWNKKLKKQILQLQVDNWKQSQDLLNRLYQETDYMWERIYKLEGDEIDLPTVSKSRGCIKIIL